MKQKLLKELTFDNNGEQIVVRVIQTEKGIQVDTEGTTMDVSVNGEIFYSKYDKEEYKYIAPSLRDFVERHLCTWGNGIQKRDGEVVCDLNISGQDYFTKISTQRAKNKYISFVDYLVSYEKIQDYKGIEIPNAKDRYIKLINDIKEVGCNLGISHDGNDYDDWYSLNVPISEFDEDKVKKCMELWDEYNAELDKFIG